MILILDGDRKRGEEVQRRLFGLHLLSDVATYASLRNRLASSLITDRVTFLLLIRPDDSARPPYFFKTFRQKHSIPTVMLNCEETARGKDANRPDLLLASSLTERIMLREVASYFLSLGRENPWDRIAGGVRDRTEYADHTVYGVPVKFTKTERLFLRTLILAFPEPVPTAELATRSAPPKSKKSENALKVTASRINRKTISALNRRIVAHDGSRYWIVTSKTDSGPAKKKEPDDAFAESRFDEYRYYPHNAF